MKNTLILLLLLVGTTQLIMAQDNDVIVYEDAENGNTEGWRVYDSSPSGAVILNVQDTERNSKVIELSGSEKSNGYVLGAFNESDAGAWKNKTVKSIKWSMNFTEEFEIFVAIETTKGHRFIVYSNEEENRGKTGQYIRHGLGADTQNGTWQTFTRNIGEDLEKYESDNNLVSINGFLVRGSGRLDDISLFNEGDVNVEVDTIPPSIIYESLSTVYLTVGDTYVETVKATDNVDGDISANVQVRGKVNTAIVGSYVLTYKVFDAAGNESDSRFRHARWVYVRPEPQTFKIVPPVITLVGGDLTFLVGQPYTELGAKALDYRGRTLSVTTSGTVNTDVEGTYVLTYTATDTEGQVVERTRTVSVKPSNVREVVYEDAESGSSKWTIYSKSPDSKWLEKFWTYRRAYENRTTYDLNRVMIFDAAGPPSKLNRFLLGAVNETDSKAWRNTSDENIRWDIRTNEDFEVMISIKTTQGHRFIVYSNEDEDRAKVGENIYHGLGESTSDGTWKRIKRNLSADLKEFEPDNTLVSVNGFIWGGTGKLDNVILFTKLRNPTDTIAPVITNTGGISYLPFDRDSYIAPHELLDGIRANDNVDGDLTSIIKVSIIGQTPSKYSYNNDYTRLEPDTYIINYTVVDAAGNESEVLTRTLITYSFYWDDRYQILKLHAEDEEIVYWSDDYFIRTESDVIRDTVNLTVGDTYVERATAFSSDYGDITDRIEIIGSVNTDVAGEYLLWYKVEDFVGSVAYGGYRLVTVTEAVDGNTSTEIYEDGENGNTDGWRVYDNSPSGASILNVQDTAKSSKVIELSGSGKANGYVLGAFNESDAGAWKNKTEEHLSWSMNVSEEFEVFVAIETTKGHRFIVYSNEKEDRGKIGQYIRHGLGESSKDGTWQTFTRNISEDLKKYESDNDLVSINGFLVRGSGRFDDIRLSGDADDGEVVDDNIAPIIDLNTGDVNLSIGSVYVEKATAIDNVDGNISDNIEIDGEVDTSIVGTYILTYNVSDAAGNQAIEKSRTVRVNAIVINPNTEIYEDAENGNTEGWRVYDNSPSGATILNVQDTEKNSKVIELSGSEKSNGYVLGAFNESDAGAWKNKTAKSITWSMNFTEEFEIFVAIETTKGHRFIVYSNEEENRGKTGQYIRHGLGADTQNGTWQTFTRNIGEDLEKYESDNNLVSINGFLVRGSGRLDDISLLNENTDVLETVAPKK